MGVAENWQQKVEKLLVNTDWTILNPRRDDWDSSWVPSIDNPQFKEQVYWELDGLAVVEQILFYFDPTTKSPITLLELGLMVGLEPYKIMVVCPKGYWRKGNVDIVCERFGIPMYSTIEEACSKL